MNFFNTFLRKTIQLVLLLSWMCIYTNAQGQSHTSGIDRGLSTSKMKSRAKHAVSIGDIYSALFYYEEITRRDSSDLSSFFEMAEYYRLSRNYKSAEATYDYVFQKSPSRYPTALYQKGLMQKMNGHYEEAKESLLAFRKNVLALNDRSLITIINREIAGCDSGIVYRDFPENVIITNAGNRVNFPHTEFSPFLIDSTTLLFGSLRLDSLQYYDPEDDENGKPPLRQVYYAEKEDEGWDEKGLFEPFNDPRMDMGNFAFSTHSGKYYFSKCGKAKDNSIRCKLYYTEKVNGKWAPPTLLPAPVNIDGATNTQPAVLVDTIYSRTATNPNMPPARGTTRPPSRGNTANNNTTTAPRNNFVIIEYLYFVSDRPGGKGGLDIWYTYYSTSKKAWVDPVNVSVLNTSETECTPFFHTPSQTLYFSSNGHINAGGLDIYKSKRDSSNRFSKPQNLSFPINSSQDELGFMLHEDGRNGVLVSNRPGGTPYFHETCCDDIFSVYIEPEKPFHCTLSLAIVLPDSSSCEGNKLHLQTLDLITSHTQRDTLVLSECLFAMQMEENKQYLFSLDSIGFQKDTLLIETRTTSCADTIVKKLVLRPIEKEKEKEVPVESTPTEGKPFVLRDIQYATDKFELNDRAKVALDSILIPFLQEHPNDKVLVSSHTDNHGSHKYNMNLSNNRALYVVKYLVSKGISPDRIEGKGYGETQPIAPNENPDGTDNPIGRAYNRRTEFLLIKKQ
jgi:outer membrane protein OmpA-like peptidoglycan-associated protein